MKQILLMSIIKMFSASFFSYYFVEIAGIPHAIKRILKLKFHQRIKPIDCVTCLSVWSAVVLYFLNIEVSVFLLIIFGAGIIGSKIVKQ